jgi:hypothetical protein
MGIIHEQTRHEFLPAEVMVDERGERESREPWKCIHLEVDNMERLTPKELRDLGKWLQQEGRRIGRAYKSNGAPRGSGERGGEGCRGHRYQGREAALQHHGQEESPNP